MGSMSPRDAVLAAQKDMASGVKGYYVAGTPNHDSLNFTVPKRNTLSIIAEDANRRASMPAPNKY